MDRENRKREGRVVIDAGEYVRREMAANPELAKQIKDELDRLELVHRIKALRKEKHLSQSQLAELAGTRQPAIARLESGRSIPRLDLLQKIARAVGMRLDFVPAHG